MLPWAVLCGAAGVGLVAGVLIGAVGVGGIIIVPTLIEFPNISVQTAIASAMFSYIAVGCAGVAAYTREKSIVWGSTVWIVLGATPGGFAGAFTLQYLADMEVKLTLYSLVLLSAIYSLYRTVATAGAGQEEEDDGDDGKDDYEGFADPADARAVVTSPAMDVIVDGSRDALNRDVDGAAHVVGYRTTCGRIARVVVGAVDGFGSSLTGTSGPVILLPILIALKWEILDALGSAQAVQTPIALAATVAYVTLRPGVIDFVLGGCLMAGLVPGAFVGAKIAHSIPVHRLKLGVSAILVVASLFLIGKLVWIEVKH